MRIAMPLVDGRLCLHFGHCDTFAVVDANPSTQEITALENMTPPAHAPGVIPEWLADQGVNVVLAGGIGGRAVALLANRGVKVITGAPSDAPEALAAAYLAGTLVTGGNACDH